VAVQAAENTSKCRGKVQEFILWSKFYLNTKPETTVLSGMAATPILKQLQFLDQ
jgi:hypothetical protein